MGNRLALTTASLLGFRPFWQASFLDFSLELFSPLSLDFGALVFCPSITALSPHRLQLLLVLTSLHRGFEPTWMSSRSSLSRGEDEEVNLSLEFQGLQITVRGSADRAAGFVQRLATEASSTRRNSPTSVSSWQEVELTPPPSPPRAVETRASVEASFPRIPRHLDLLATSLSTASRGWTSEERVRRAWTAGNWAAAARSGRVQSPNRTPTIDLPNKYYVVVQGPNIDSPRVYKTSRELFAAVGALEGSSTICHGFPSKAEAQIYLAGAGYTDVPCP